MKETEIVRLEGKVNLIDNKMDNLKESFDNFQTGLFKLHEDRAAEIKEIRSDVTDLKNFKFKLIGIGIMVIFLSSIITASIVYVIKHI